VTVSVRVTQDCSLPIADEQETVVDIEVWTFVQAVRTGKAGAQDVRGISLNCSWTVAKLSRYSITLFGRGPALNVVDVAANEMTKDPGSSVDGKVNAVVPTVPSQSLSPEDVLVGSNVLSARPTKPSSKPYVVGHGLLA
jgi:hypothetical protein